VTVDQATDKSFELEVATDTVWLAPVDSKDSNQCAMPSRSDISPDGFFRITCNGKPPENGVFQLEGKPVQPRIEWIPGGGKRGNEQRAAHVGKNNTGRFGLKVTSAGAYTFRAAVGNAWSKQVTIQVRHIPFNLKTEPPDFLEQYGNPDAKVEHGYLWLYRTWPSLGLRAAQGGKGLEPQQMTKSRWEELINESQVSSPGKETAKQPLEITGQEKAFLPPSDPSIKYTVVVSGSRATVYEWTSGKWHAVGEGNVVDRRKDSPEPRMIPGAGYY
jgi:hypothetical protein